MKRITAIAAIAWALCAAASAQQAPNPIIQHYRAYQAALEANDLATAETEATAALAASEARDGEGGRTAILALNLATVRFQRNDATGALAPARRALGQAEQRGEASGVPLTLARLMVTRAELAGGDVTAADRLAALLVTAQQEQLDAAEIYDAAVQLGVWGLRQERYDLAQSAWATAGASAEGSRLPAQMARGQARTGEGASILLADVINRRRDAPFSPEAATEAFEMLTDAQQMLDPYARTSPDGRVTLGLRTYGEARAWIAVLRAKLQADGQPLPVLRQAQGDADGLVELQSNGGGSAPVAPRCLFNVGLHDGPSLYPDLAARRGRVAGVVMLLHTNDSGEVARVQTVAEIGMPDFAQALLDPAVWDVSVRENSAPNCRRAISIMRAIAFTLPPDGPDTVGYRSRN